MFLIKVKSYTGFLIFLLAGCATLNPNFENPEVTVSSFRVLPSDGLPKFEIKLRVINPNSTELKLRGISYSASIQGHKVLSGVTNKIPVIGAYSEGEVKLTGGISLLGGFHFLSDLMQQKNTGMNYQLNVKMDVGSFMPAIRVEKSGEILPSAR
jgi:LEA14-like dessication related protein